LPVSSTTKAAIWDMDGTLVDTAELHFQAWETVCAELGRPFTRADFAATFGQRNPEIFEYLFGNRFDEAKIAALGDHKEELYRAAAKQRGITPLPGVSALVAGLRQAGFRQAISTGQPGFDP
jgi:beta-phosphoglucomutase